LRASVHNCLSSCEKLTERVQRCMLNILRAKAFFDPLASFGIGLSVGNHGIALDPRHSVCLADPVVSFASAAGFGYAQFIALQQLTKNRARFCLVGSKCRSPSSAQANYDTR